MAEPDRETPKPSVTMQRIALNRDRVFALTAIVIGVLWTLIAGALVFSGGNLAIHIAQLIVGAVFLVVGVLRLFNVRKQLRRFEEENGPGAGDQKPLR